MIDLNRIEAGWVCSDKCQAVERGEHHIECQSPLVTTVAPEDRKIVLAMVAAIRAAQRLRPYVFASFSAGARDVMGDKGNAVKAFDKAFEPFSDD